MDLSQDLSTTDLHNLFLHFLEGEKKVSVNRLGVNCGPTSLLKELQVLAVTQINQKHLG